MSRDSRAPYPDPRYHGEGGEPSATFRASGTPPELEYPNGTRVRYLASGAATGGLFGLFRWEMGPAASGPGPHFHRTIAESFYILDGAMRLFDGRAWIDASPGDWLHVPPGGIHGFRNESGAPATMLIHFAPGAPREGYFEGLARFARDGQPSEADLDAFLREHDNLLVR